MPNMLTMLLLTPFHSPNVLGLLSFDLDRLQGEIQAEVPRFQIIANVISVNVSLNWVHTKDS